MHTIIRRNTALCIFLVSLTYYYILAAKEWTWIFVSGDSGAWLATAYTWMVPQPLGSPLYVSLGHLLNWFPGDLVLKMTIGLSVIPAAVSVALVYLIVCKMTESRDADGTGKPSHFIAVVSASVLLACGVFLSQATILEEYTLPTMFLTLAFWFYVNDHKWGTVLALATGAAVHSIVIMIAIMWLVLQYRNRKQWGKPILVFAVITILSYCMIPILMAMDTPRLMAGWLSLRGFVGYCTDTGGATIGTISINDVPMRIVATVSILLLSYGLAMIPAIIGMKRTIGSTTTRMLIAAVASTLWLSLTSIDPTTWTFMCFGSPMVAILAAIGLSKLPRGHGMTVVIVAVILLVTNGFFLNASTLTRDNPWATDFEKDIQELPYAASVVIPMGGPHSLGVMKAVVIDRPDIIPLFMGGAKPDGTLPPKWAGYLDWMHNKKGMDVVASRYEDGLVNSDDIVRWSVADGRDVFWCSVTELPGWEDKWQAVVRFNDSFERIIEP